MPEFITKAVRTDIKEEKKKGNKMNGRKGMLNGLRKRINSYPAAPHTDRFSC